MGSQFDNQEAEIERLKKELLFYSAYDSFIKKSTDLFCTFNDDLTIVLAGFNFSTLGYKVTQLEGASFTQIIAPSDAKATLDCIQEAKRTRKTATIINKTIRSSGCFYYYQ